MGSQVPQAHPRRKVRGSEDSHGLREENLTPVPDRADTGGAMHVQADVVTSSADRLAGVQAHPYSERCAVWPGVLHQ
jgi:hypothetical protein